MEFILIEEDDDVREMISMLLTFQGHNVASTSSGIQGENLVGRSECASVIVSLTLTDISGVRLISQIRKLRSYRGCKIFALLESNDSNVQREALDAGANRVFVRSDDIGQLLQFTE